MKFYIAYGLPASGKSTYLRNLSGKYLDLDNRKIQDVKSIIENLNNGTYALDLLIKDPNDFITYLNDVHTNCEINIKILKTSRTICLERDKKRNINRQSQILIKRMKLIPIL